MKKFILAAIIAVFSLSASAQTVKKDAKGNFIAVSAARADSMATGQTFTDKAGKVYKVYKGGRGGLFYWGVATKGAKAGQLVKRYIKVS